MRLRVLPVILVLSVVLTGCAARAEAGKIAAVQEIAEGDKLVAAKDYDRALERYVKAANECTSSPVHDEALSKAATALALKVDDEPLPRQVEAVQQFLTKIPSPILPLRAHNWLSDTLRTDAEAAVTLAKAASAENKRVIAASTPPKTTKKPAVAKKPAPKKTAAKPKTTVKPASATTATAVATVSVAATRTAAATSSAPATEAPVPEFARCSSAELRVVSEALPGLGQPPAMQQLYASLAEIKAAMEASEKARSAYRPKRPLTLAQRRTLAAADARLAKALAKVGGLLASL